MPVLERDGEVQALHLTQHPDRAVELRRDAGC
jgi:hypothetical protein